MLGFPSTIRRDRQLSVRPEDAPLALQEESLAALTARKRQPQEDPAPMGSSRKEPPAGSTADEETQ